MEIDLDGHGGGNPRGAFGFTLTATEIATGWTETRTVRSKAQVHVVAAVADVLEPSWSPCSSRSAGSTPEMTVNGAVVPSMPVNAHC